MTIKHYLFSINTIYGYAYRQEPFRFRYEVLEIYVINDGVVEKWWQEPGINNEGLDDDPTLKVHLKMLLTIYEIISRLLTKGHQHYYIMKIIKEETLL